MYIYIPLSLSLYLSKINPARRATAQEAQRHPWLQDADHMWDRDRDSGISREQAEEKSDDKIIQKYDAPCKGDKDKPDDSEHRAMKTARNGSDNGRSLELSEEKNGFEKNINPTRHTGSKQSSCKEEY
jgi:hypothetical protein